MEVEVLAHGHITLPVTEEQHNILFNHPDSLEASEVWQDIFDTHGLGTGHDEDDVFDYEVINDDHNVTVGIRVSSYYEYADEQMNLPDDFDEYEVVGEPNNFTRDGFERFTQASDYELEVYPA